MPPSKHSRASDATLGRGMGNSLIASAGAPGAPPGLASGVFSYAASGAGGLPAAVYPKDSVRDAADALGLSGVRDQVLGALAGDVEYRLRDVLQDAAKYMRHAKRAQLRTSDIDAALRAKNIEPLYGYFPATTGRSNATAAMRAPAFRKTQHASGVLYYLEDEEIDFDDILHAGPVLALGKGVGWSSHWLAIEGIQPAVPQNPSPADLGLTSQENGTANGTASGTANGIATPDAPVVVPASLNGGATVWNKENVIVRPLVKHVLSRELQLYFERLTQAVANPPSSADTPTTADTVPITRVDEDVQHTLPPASDSYSKSLDQIAKSGSGNSVRDAALASLRGDPGLHQLVPYLVQWVGEKISFGLLDTTLLEHMMLVVHALLINPHIFIEPYLHQLMPSVLSVLLTASMGQPSETSLGAGYSVRTHTALLLAHISVNYGRSYSSLRPRVVSTLLKALLAGTEEGNATGTEPKLDNMQQTGAEALAAAEASKTAPTPAVATKLGALLGLRCLGGAAVQTFLLGPAGVAPVSGDAQYEYNALYRLGGWVERLAEADKEAAAWLSREVRLALHEAAPLTGLPPSESESRSDIERVYGAFWASQFVSDPLARKALVGAEAKVQASSSGPNLKEEDVTMAESAKSPSPPPPAPVEPPTALTDSDDKPDA